MRSRLVALLSVLAVLAMLAAACGPAATPTSAPEPTSPREATPPLQPEETPTAPPPTIKRGGVLKFGSTAEPTDLDPAFSGASNEQSHIFPYVFDSLTEWDWETLEPVPALADVPL